MTIQNVLPQPRQCWQDIRGYRRSPDDVLPIGKYGNNFIFRSGSGYIQGKIHGEKFDMILLPFPSERRMGHSILSISADETTRAKEFEVYIKDWFAKRTKCFAKRQCSSNSFTYFCYG